MTTPTDHQTAERGFGSPFLNALKYERLGSSMQVVALRTAATYRGCQASSSGGAVTKYKVLLADDDSGLRKLVGTTLGTEDFYLFHAADGEETLALARAEHPDIVLLDINMPKKNGLEVCRELKQAAETARTKIVMLTASGSEADKARATEAQADDYFVKPFSPVALLNKIYALLG